MKRLFSALVCAGGLFAAVSSFAKESPVLISGAGGWKAYHHMDNGAKFCYVAGQPAKQEGNFSKRGEVTFFVTRWPDEKNKNVISVAGGYPFKPGSTPLLEIGDKKFSLFTQGETAWAQDPAADEAVIKELQTTASMVVRGISRRDTETTDTYSLEGFADAYRTMAEECDGKTKK